MAEVSRAKKNTNVLEYLKNFCQVKIKKAEQAFREETNGFEELQVSKKCVRMKNVPKDIITNYLSKLPQKDGIDPDDAALLPWGDGGVLESGSTMFKKLNDKKDRMDAYIICVCEGSKEGCVHFLMLKGWIEFKLAPNRIIKHTQTSGSFFGIYKWNKEYQTILHEEKNMETADMSLIEAFLFSQICDHASQEDLKMVQAAEAANLAQHSPNLHRNQDIMNEASQVHIHANGSNLAFGGDVHSRRSVLNNINTDELSDIEELD